MIKKILNYFDIPLLFLLIITNELLIRYFCGLELFVFQSFLYDIFFFLFLVAILILLNKMWRKIAEVIIITIISVYSFAQSFHYIFFKTFFSFRKLTVGGELANVIGEIFDKFNPLFFLFIIPIIIMCLYKTSDYEFKFKTKIISIISLCLLGVLGLNGIKLYLSNDYASDKSWQKDYYLLSWMQNKTRYLDRFGIGQYIYKDICLTFKPVQELTEEEKVQVDEFVDNYNDVETNEMTGFFEGKNLIVILCESFDESAILSDLTPTLYKLQNEGYYFNNYYAPIYEVATGDSEFISQTGMVPSIDYGTTSYTFHLNHYPNALANLFKDEGYKVNSFHSYISNFYNREAIHESFGFETFYDMDKLNLKRFEGYKETINWIKDEELFRAMLEKTDYSEPFYNFVITASGHMPYRSSRKELEENLEVINANPKYQNLNNEVKNYYAAQMLLDQGLEVLIEGLEAKGELDDTVIVLFGDHYPYGLSNEEAIKYLLKDEESVEVYKVPLIIYNSELEGRIDNTICSTFDLYPTIANLFNLDTSAYYKAGYDIFADNIDRFVLFEDGSLLSEYIYYDSGSNTITGLNGVDDDTALMFYNEIAPKAQDLLKYSQDILLSDYYRDEE